ncbi:hypothetical protein CAPTEDRAFT_189464 [Capitella teleta]|uniref:FAM194 C-terminal domain-containing protein n=1 Tax=Capitella teleta TaxID=283909 RepID=R7V0G1_CAPTE|nr:hypothetical protein CAPTEDRAFT_189464 [Capitella teleta]|eukprot:ELU12323.1 hypothetical protein CAPTEDRAFT_189464 [Capitella teleta]
MSEPEKDTFFFEQRCMRKGPKRFRKAPEDLPQDLRFAHLNPRIAAYLASKEKEKIAEEISEELKAEGMLPEINQKVHIIKNRLDCYLASSDDVTRGALQELKSQSQGVLAQLAKVLYLFEGLQPTLPKSLEGNLLETWRELTCSVVKVYREWQIPQNREQYLLRKQQKDHCSTSESDRDSVAKTGSVHGSPRDNLDESDGHRRKKGGRNLGLADISERDEARAQGEGMAHLIRQQVEGMGSLIPPLRRESSRNSRLSKRRPNSGQVSSRKKNSSRSDDALSIGSHGSDLGKGERLFGLIYFGWNISVVFSGAGGGGGGGREQPSFWAVIQFQLSSKACEDKGWIMHPDGGKDPDVESILHSIIHRLQISLKQQRDQASHNRDTNNDCLVLRRYYGDSHNEQIKKYKLGRRTAMITCRNTNDRPGMYAFAYDDDSADQKMLACFTPSGRGCCYYSNGVVRFLATDEGGTIADEDGAVTKRWSWPEGRLKEPIVLQLSPHFTLKCFGLGVVSLSFSCQKESYKVHLSAVVGTEKEDKENSLMTSFHFSSNMARELMRPQKLRNQLKKGRTGRPRMKSPTLSTDLQKLIDFPEPTENDPDSEKSLIKLQRKAKNLVDDWMEHYRIALHIASPTLKAVRDTPMNASRAINSAKMTHTPGQVYLIDRESTKIPSPDIGARIPSAPPGLNGERVIKHVSIPVPVKPELMAVKFDELQDQSEFLQDERLPLSFAPASFSSPLLPSTKPASRTRSAPQRLFLMTQDSEAPEGLGPDASLCPIALREGLLSGSNGYCKCTRHKIPVITDVEFDEFVFTRCCEDQLIIISVVSSLYPDSSPSSAMLEKLYTDKNKNRTRPCLQSKQDVFRLFKYDVASAADLCTHSQPTLLRRHNVVPGMFLMYQGSQLVFCDHIFNGYGAERKDFQKQLLQTRRSARKGYCLPKDFRFSPLKGRHGQRSGWGGEIGGAGVNRHGNVGLTPNEDGMHAGSSDSSESDFPRPQISYVVPAKYLSLSVENSLPTIHESLPVITVTNNDSTKPLNKTNAAISIS